MSIRNIKRYQSAVTRSLFYIDGNLDYPRLTSAIDKLARLILETDLPDDFWLDDCDYSDYSVAEIIVGAYWHFSEWHAGQSSIGYSALSSLGMVYSPGCSGPEPENETYQALDSLAREYFQ